MAASASEPGQPAEGAGVLDAMLEFVREIGIEVRHEEIESRSVVPGIAIRDGGLVVDMDALAYPGDLLHEAAHLAVMAPSVRRTATDPIDANPGDEMAALAWSWAAAAHLGIDASVVFHADGYRGGSASLVAAYRGGGLLGQPLLQWFGMTTIEAFPAMTTWVRTTEPPMS